MSCKQVWIAAVLVAGMSGLLLSGCATTRTLDPNQSLHYDASYDFSDKRKIVADLTSSLLAAAPAAAGKRPILIIYDVANETSEHINTSGITDDIRLELIRSGKYRFINEAQRKNLAREAAYQAVAVDPRMRAEQGKKLGADYILSGTLRSIEKKDVRQIRLTKKKYVYYSLNMELTDLTTGEIAWADKVEIARESSRPIIGW